MKANGCSKEFCNLHVKKDFKVITVIIVNVPNFWKRYENTGRNRQVYCVNMNVKKNAFTMRVKESMSRGHSSLPVEKGGGGE